MLKRIALLLVFSLLFPSFAYAGAYYASSVAVIDKDTCEILYESNAYENRAVASTTKIMTALIALESGKLSQTVTVSEEMLKTEGSSLGISVGDKITLYDIVVGMMLTSGNDAANACAYFISGSIGAFAETMNKRAEEIGMKNTLFVTPSGLDEGNNHSSAYDMAILTAQALDNNAFSKICSMKSTEITVNGKKQTVYNHNKLLSYDFDDGEEFIGVKTGYTKKAGRCLVSARNYKSNIIICVTLNCPDDWNAHVYYTDLCKKKYNRIVISNNVKISVVGGKADYINAVYEKEFYLLSQASVYEYYMPFVYAPVKKGDKIGEAVVKYNDKIIERLPIEADGDVKYYANEEFGTTSKIYG